jgi:hypothetical protein
MRIRSRDIILEEAVRSAGEHNYLFTKHCGGGTSGSSTPLTRGALNISTHLIRERIADDLGRGQPHVCLHRREDRKIVTGDGLTQGTTGPGGSFGVGVEDTPKMLSGVNYNIHEAVTGLWDLTDFTEPPPRWFVSYPDFDESVVINNLHDKARQLSADVLLNIVEANQMWPSMNSLTTDLITDLPSSTGRRKRLTKERLWKAIRSQLKTRSGQFLAWKFGIAPILSDMIKIHKELPLISDKIKRFVNEDANRYSQVIDGSAHYTVPSFDETIVNGVNVWEDSGQGVVNVLPHWRYVLVVKPNNRLKASDFIEKTDFFLRRYASSPADLAWELIPYSFVVDWFVDVRGVLRALDRLVGVEPYKVVSFTRSRSYELATTSTSTRRNPCGGGAVASGACGTSVFRNYERSIVSNPAFWPSWKPRFGKNQAAISAALITQALLKKR